MEGFEDVRAAKTKWLVWSALIVVILLAVFLTSRFWYTPTSSGTVVNDTSSTWSLSNCEDYLVTLVPGEKQSVEPFVSADNGCTVYRGRNDLGKPVGCLVFPHKNGNVIGGSEMKMSMMVVYSPERCSS
jgi:hypothetical protein